jgi:hypothetical protein
MSRGPKQFCHDFRFPHSLDLVIFTHAAGFFAVVNGPESFSFPMEPDWHLAQDLPGERQSFHANSKFVRHSHHFFKILG